MAPSNLEDLGSSFPHIIDSIIIFSDEETRRRLRLTSRFLRRYVDQTLCRELRGLFWHPEEFGVFVRNVNDDVKVVCRWGEQPILRGLKRAEAVFINELPAAVIESVSRQVSPEVVPYICHSGSECQYRLDKATRAVLDVNLLECSCNEPAFDYRLKVTEVLVTLWWQSAGWYHPVTGVPTPGLPTGVFYPPGKEPRIRFPTTCGLLQQVLHPGLTSLRLLCPLTLLHAEAPAFIFPKPAPDFTLPGQFKMAIEINSLEDPESAEAQEVKAAFATHLGVPETQVVVEREGTQPRPHWWPPVYSVLV